MRKMFAWIMLLCALLLLSACGESADMETKTRPGENEIGEISATATSTSDTSTPEVTADPSTPDNSETTSQSPATDSTSTNSPNNTAGTTSKSSGNSTASSTSKPQDQTPSQTTPPPATSTLSTTPSNPPTPSTPPTPEYEVLGQEFINGVLKGMNDRRAALGLPLAKLNSALSDECLVQAKKMADAGYDFHSDKPTGCESTMKVPYNFPAELMGDQMCNHVADFTYEATTKIGIAVVKKGNSLYVVIQGTA